MCPNTQPQRLLKSYGMQLETECPVAPNGKHVWVTFDKTRGCAECGTKRFETEAD